MHPKYGFFLFFNYFLILKIWQIFPQVLEKKLVKFTVEEKSKTHYSSTIFPIFFLLKLNIKIADPKTHTETSKIYKSLGMIGL